MRYSPVVSNTQIKGAIGLAVRAGGAALGTDACREAISRGKAKLLLLDPSASEATRRTWRESSAYLGIPLMLLPEKGLLEEAAGRVNVRVMAVTDPNFSKLILSRMENREN